MSQSIRRIENAVLFGHYDSRGGATLYTGMKFSEALQCYVNVLSGDSFDEEDIARCEWSAMEDYIGIFNVLIFGEGEFESDDGREALKQYGGEWNVGRVYERYTSYGGSKRWSETNVMVAWKGKKPDVTEAMLAGKTNFLGWKYTVRSWNLGEDAFGLIVN
jgi:hypothetical protein